MIHGEKEMVLCCHMRVWKDKASYCDRDHTMLEHEAMTNHCVHVVVCTCRCYVDM